MSDHRPSEKPVAIGERRIHARTPVTPQAFVKFGDNNYGFVFNISETGLVFAPTGTLTLAVGASAKLRFQLPDSKEWIQANGEIVWIAESQKEAGVRFIDLTEDTRSKIRNWISQEPSHSNTPETPNKLSEGEDSLSEDRLSHTIAIARRSLPPDALPKDKVLNSIFADPGLFLVEAKSARVKPAAQPSPAALGEPPQGSSASHIPERRSQPRRRVLSLEYLDLGDSNGGIILNISEGGMYIQAVASLSADELSDLSFRIPDSGYQIETSGKIVWVGESRKDAGIQFINLPEEARLKLREWVAAENPEREEFRQIERPARTGESVAEAAPSSQKNERVIATPQSDQPKVPLQPANPPADRVSFIDRLISKRPDSVAKKIDPDAARPVSQNPGQSRPAASAIEMPPASAPSAGNSAPNGAQIGNSERNLVAPAASTPAAKIPEVSTSKSEVPKADSAARGDRKVVAPASSNVGAKTPVTPNPSPAESSDRKIVAPASINIGAKIRNSSDSKLAAPAALSAPQDHAKLPASDIFAAEPLEPVIAVQRFSDSTVAPTASAEPEAQPSNWRRLAAVISAIVLVSFAAGWIAAGPTGRKQFLDIFVSQQSDSSPQPENPGATSAERDAPVAATHETASAQTDAPIRSVPAGSAADSTPSQPATPTPSGAPKENVGAIAPENVPTPKQPERAAPSSTTTPLSAPGATNRAQPQPPPAVAASSKSPNVVEKNTPPPATAPSNAPGPVTSNIPAPANISAPKPSDIQKKSATTADSKLAIQAVVLPPNTNPPALPEPSRADSSQPAISPQPPDLTEIVKGTVSVSASPFPSIRVPPELKSQISKQGASLQIGQLISRVEPTYPEDAERQRIEGVVKLHAIIARDGSIQDIDQMSGPPLLVAAAANAVRQWRYKPTSLDGHPVEATESVTVTFRLQSTHPN